ncbi:hypothetical protein VMCG_07732 [Cytospora schulzeri]|uniref:Uncharacterized protein n=1 Tax=Cytospora schulzeri TaxID=448051 RepID=A0A423VZ03_9PEZI|nr:hypothetical protein VMCG_07732 [Valsa malicola]
MSGRGPSSRLAADDAEDRVFAAGDALAEAKEARARARAALAHAEEAIWRAVYRQSVELEGLAALQRNLGDFGANQPASVDCCQPVTHAKLTTADLESSALSVAYLLKLELMEMSQGF